MPEQVVDEIPLGLGLVVKIHLLNFMLKSLRYVHALSTIYKALVHQGSCTWTHSYCRSV